MLKILYVDADPEFQEYVSFILESGYECGVICLDIVNDAINELKRNKKIDLVLSGHKMKGGNGDVLYKFIRNNNIQVPFVLLAPEDPTESYSGFQNDSFATFIKTPFKDNDFFECMEKVFSDVNIMKSGNFSASSSVAISDDGEEEVSNDPMSELDALENDLKSIRSNKGGDYDIYGGGKDAGDLIFENFEKGDEAFLDNDTDDSNESGESLDEEEESLRGDKFSWSDIKDDSEWNINDSLLADYCKVKIGRFLVFSSGPADIYIKLSDQKYVKVFRKNSYMDEKQLQKYIKKDITHLYIRKDEFKNFSDLLGNAIMQKVQEKGLSGREKVLGGLVTLEHVHEQVRSYGISDLSIKLTQSTVHSCQSIIEKSDMGDLLKNVMRGKNYLSEHSLLLSYFSVEIAMNSEYSNQTVLDKLAMASLMHDSVLDESILEKVKGHELEDDLPLTPDEKKIYEKHPILAASLFKDVKGVFSDVDNIIIQHHERPTGDGFPRKLSSSRIMPLACILIIAEDVINHLELGKEMKEIKEIFESKYATGNFRKPLKGFLKGFSL